MPNLNGVDACKVIKQSNPEMTVVAVTANVFSDDLDTYQQVGFDHCLAKPIDLQELYSLLEAFTSR